MPPPAKVSTGTITDPIHHAPKSRKSKAPPVPFRTSSTQTNPTVSKKSTAIFTMSDEFSNNDNDSTNMDSLPNEDYNIKNNNTRNVESNFSDFNRNYNIAPTLTAIQRESKIPIKSTKKSSKNQYTLPSSLDANSNFSVKPRMITNKSPLNYIDSVTNDFFRGTTLNQSNRSFSKDVTSRFSKNRLSTYEQNFIIPQTEAVNMGRPKSSPVLISRNNEPLVDELYLRYKQYNSGNLMNNLRGSTLQKTSFQPRTIDRAEI